MKIKNKQFPRGYFGNPNSENIPSKKDLNKNLSKFKLKTIVPFIKSLPEGATVLDAGCGAGKTIKIIMAYRPDIKITGVDITDTQDFLPKNINFSVSSVERVGELFEENSFDTIICQHVFEHLVSPISATKSFQKVLKTDGLLYLEVPNWTRSKFPFLDMFFWNDYTHIRIFSKQTLINLFEDFNFDIIYYPIFGSQNPRL